MPTIYFKGTADQAKQAVRIALAIAVGKTPDPTGVASQMQLLMGTEALSIIKDAFVVKAQGGTDEAGLSWPPLKPETIAYSRRHPGLESLKKKNIAKGRHPSRPLLTAEQDKLWRRTFARTLHWLTGKKGVASTQAKAIAAANAWIIVKANGGQTIIGKYGSTKVEILRDTGVLLNSLSPGVDSAHVAASNSMTARMSQVFRIMPAEVIVGTNVRYAAAHHYGIPGKLPQRRLWAEPKSWPATWMARLGEVARYGTITLITKLLNAA